MHGILADQTLSWVTPFPSVKGPRTLISMLVHKATRGPRILFQREEEEHDRL